MTIELNDLRALQKALPWSIAYSLPFLAASTDLDHLDAQHALLHIYKSMGKLSGLFEKLDHGNDPTDDAVNDVPNLVADLVICALRIANVAPWGRFDLADAVKHRLEVRNGIKL